MKFSNITYSILLFGSAVAFSQPGPIPLPKTNPKLVIGIVIDQMRADYIARYWNRFGNDGFKRLITEGFNCKNTNFNYVPTYTGPGHASIFTGSTPSVHGIIGNSWFDRTSSKMIYCSQDAFVTGTGGSELHGKMSPVNLLTTTF